MVAGAILYKHGRIQHFIPYTHPQGAGSPPTHAVRRCLETTKGASGLLTTPVLFPSEPSPSTSSLKPPASSSHHLSSKQFRKHPRTRTRAPRTAHRACHRTAGATARGVYAEYILVAQINIQGAFSPNIQTSYPYIPYTRH